LGATSPSKNLANVSSSSMRKKPTNLLLNAVIGRERSRTSRGRREHLE
jgi:hypothetical protein